ncbi:MAG: hypothetical protein IJ876_02610 [Elusimicrobiaceae bacterium]|nr:hypothetical protein [Elusimicrobiaceae bacterium]
MSVEKAIKECYQVRTSKGFLYRLPKDFPAFRGHFEGHPLLPAVCQISFCSDAASHFLGKEVEMAAIKRAKFMSPALPDSTLEVSLILRPDGWYFAELTDPCNGKKLSQLILQFSERK